jgi:hypothetical protein
VTGGRAIDQRVDLDAVLDDRSDQLARQLCCHRITFRVGEMPLEDRLSGALAEVGLEDRGERESTSRSPSALPVSLRRHRR